MIQALEGLKHINKAIEETKNVCRTIAVKYHHSDTRIVIFENDPEQDTKPGRSLQFIEMRDEPFDFNAPINKKKLPF